PRALPSFPTRRSSDLFRLSEHRGAAARDSLAAQVALFRPREILHPEDVSLGRLLPDESLEGVLTRAVPGWTLAAGAASRLLNEVDRKSTRLNSSHDQS